MSTQKLHGSPTRCTNQLYPFIPCATTQVTHTNNLQTTIGTYWSLHSAYKKPTRFGIYIPNSKSFIPP